MKWGIGYDQNNKDGLYVTRNSDPINFGNEKIELKLRNEFYLQRALKEKLKVLRKKINPIHDKINQESKLSDLFGIGTNINANIIGFNFAESEINTLDINKFNNSFTSKYIGKGSF